MKKAVTPLIRIAGVLATLFFCGCASMTGIKPQAKLLESEALSVNKNKLTAARYTAAWWEQYHHPVLDRLVASAIQGNPSLKLAQARVRQSDAFAALTGATDGPQMDFTTNVTRRHLSEYGQLPAPLGGSVSSLYETGLSFNYIFDIWGKTRAEVAAALSEKAALQVEADESRRMLSLAVTSRYFQVIALQKDIGFLTEAIAYRRAMLQVLQAQHRAGIVQKDQEEGMRAQSEDDEQTLIAATAQLEKTKNALAALLAMTAAQLPAIEQTDLPLPQLTNLPGLNTNMLAWRADIRAARWRVESYQKSVDAAKAEFYPTISLSAFAGYNALHFADWFKYNAYQTMATPAVNLPIFRAGKLRANLRGKIAQYDQAVENYNQTLVAAVQDAADKYVDLQSAEHNVAHENRANQAIYAAAKISADRYRVGILTKLNYLEAQTRLIQARRRFNAAQNQRLQSELAMIQAIGGEKMEDKVENAESVRERNNG